MKKVIYSLFYFTILIVINILVANFFKVEFIELSFFTGLISSIVIGFFSSEGCITTTMTDLPLKHLLNKEARNDSSIPKFYINIPFIVSIVYTILAAIVSIITYWKYF